MDDDTQAKALEAANEKMADAEAFDALVKFDFEEGGAIFLDGSTTPPIALLQSAAEPDCVISASMETFREMLDGDLDPTSAFMTGRISIDGDMGAAMKVAQLFS